MKIPGKRKEKMGVRTTGGGEKKQQPVHRDDASGRQNTYVRQVQLWEEASEKGPVREKCKIKGKNPEPSYPVKQGARPKKQEH